MAHGYLVLVLHAHLPYVIGHGRWPHGVEWLYEATCETYIPLLNLLTRLSKKGQKARLTVGLTPILCEMLASDVFKAELKDYIQKRMEAARQDRLRFSEAGEEERAGLSARWVLFYEAALHDFAVNYGENLLEAFKGFQSEGQIEIITSSATHAYLPMVGSDGCISAQVRQGIESYHSFFGRKPKGIWLPECGYRPASSLPSPASNNGHVEYRKGIEEVLAENGIEYFFLDTHILAAGTSIDEDRLGLSEVFGSPGFNIDEATDTEFEDLPYCGSMGHVQGQWKPQDEGRNAFGPQARRMERDHLSPHFAGSSFSKSVCTFLTREPVVSMQVWSQDHGYPGDGDYLEFHKKDSGSGLRYWKVTDRAARLDAKKIYRPHDSASKARAHAVHFVSCASSLLESYYSKTGKPGVLTAPFDAELFGHWWFEGMQWLETVIELLSEEPRIEISYPHEILRKIKPTKTLMLPEGSWGQGGCHTMWYNKETAWMWESIHKAERAMYEALGSRLPVNPLSERVLRQMGRELLLLQASDWEFLVTTGTARDYAESRFSGHEENFFWLREMFEQSGKDAGLTNESIERLTAIEQKNHVFDNIELSWFRERTENGL